MGEISDMKKKKKKKVTIIKGPVSDKKNLQIT